MAEKKESYFWTSYSDLMTSLFFIMLTLFVLMIVLLNRNIQTTQKIAETARIKEDEYKATEKQMKEITKLETSTKELDKSRYYEYRPEYKKYVLTVKSTFDRDKSSQKDLKSDTAALRKAGQEIESFLKRHSDYHYLLIIEGQASRDSYEEAERNYHLSFSRGLTLMKYWKDNCKIDFGYNCEIQIAGSGDGRYNFGYTGGENTESFRKHDATLMREPKLRETENQRFIIHILPKNVMEEKE